MSWNYIMITYLNTDMEYGSGCCRRNQKWPKSPLSLLESTSLLMLSSLNLFFSWSKASCPWPTLSELRIVIPGLLSFFPEETRSQQSETYPERVNPFWTDWSELCSADQRSSSKPSQSASWHTEVIVSSWIPWIITLNRQIWVAELTAGLFPNTKLTKYAKGRRWASFGSSPQKK